jgi:hypothetical protein
MQVSKLKARRYDLSKYPNLSIRSFALRELTGEDIVLAAERVAIGTAKVDDNTYGLLLRNQMIAGAIVEVDGETVKGASCQAFLGWNVRTRDFVQRAFDHMNSVSDKERSDFLALLDQPESAEQLSAQGNDATP